MSENQVIKLTPIKINEMKRFYATYCLAKKPPYTEFVAKIDHTTITAYTSGKVMFQGKNAETFAKKWQTTDCSTTDKTNSASLPADLKHRSLIGSDEVGNGSYFGALVVCATFVDKTMLSTLNDLGVKDSKELTDSKIIQLATLLKKSIPYQLLVLKPEKYNQIQPNYNAVHMKVALHNQAIHLLLKKIAPTKPEYILIDQFTPKKNYMKYVTTEKNQVSEPLYFATKGEQYHLSVAAASIISRAAFLEELTIASNELGIQLPSGAGKQADQVAAEILQLGGIDLLSQYVKLHFANTQKAMKLAEKKR